MRRTLTALTVVGALTLTGCAASEPTPEPTPTPTEQKLMSANAAACPSFVTAASNLQRLATAKDGTGELTAWAAEVEKERGKMVTAAYVAKGEVQTRMNAMLDAIPENAIRLNVELYKNTALYEMNFKRVMNACEDAE